jgi:hypothetical protein
MRRRPLATLTRAAAKWAREIRCTECASMAWTFRATEEAFRRRGFPASEFCCDWSADAGQIALFDFELVVEDE